MVASRDKVSQGLEGILVQSKSVQYIPGEENNVAFIQQLDGKRRLVVALTITDVFDFQ